MLLAYRVFVAVSVNIFLWSYVLYIATLKNAYQMILIIILITKSAIHVTIYDQNI